MVILAVNRTRIQVFELSYFLLCRNLSFRIKSYSFALVVMKYISRCLFSSKVMVRRFTVCNLHEFAAFQNLIVRFCQLVIAIEKFFFICTEMLLKIMASWLVLLFSSYSCIFCVFQIPWLTWVDKHFLLE